MSLLRVYAPSLLLQVRSWLHPFKGHCEQKAMRDEGVIYVAGHPLLNRRCTRLPGCICLRNDLYCVGWGVKLYSLTHTCFNFMVIVLKLMFFLLFFTSLIVHVWQMTTMANLQPLQYYLRSHKRNEHNRNTSITMSLSSSSAICDSSCWTCFL